jgi:hypothetical protein
LAEQTVPAFHGNIAFNAQHSPMGAFFSFTCGHFGTTGGFGLQVGKPGNQDLYIGVKDGGRNSAAPLKCLPFYEGAKDDAAAAFQVEQQRSTDTAHRRRLVAYAKQQIKRHYGWGTDRWVTKDFEFIIYTPFGTLHEPQTVGSDLQRESLAPAVVAELVVDNRRGKTAKTALFAVSFPDRAVRQLDGLPPGSIGFGLRRELGFAGNVRDLDRPKADCGSAAYPVLRWSPTAAFDDPNAIHLLGSCPGIAVEVPAGKRYALRLALGVYLDGTVTTRLEGRYLYTRYFANLEDVLSHALVHHDDSTAAAQRRDDELLASGLSADQQFLIAHSTRSYYGSTQLLDVGGEPFWVVNEGEYCMMNTLDLSVDHVFWELEQNPWVVRNLLDNFVRHYSYQDQVKAPGGGLRPGGLSFSHDMGVNNNFSPSGDSSYELPHLNALCFSYMTAEQLCNWTLMAACYFSKTGDLEWARRAQPTLLACLASMINRSGADGFVQFDSSRCGEDGAEITTYDSLDHSLAQTRNNVYMACKCWASYLGLAMLLKALGDENAKRAGEMAATVERALPRHAGTDGVLPAVFEPDNAGYRSRILPAAEGLVYPLYWGKLGAASSMQEILGRHTLALLLDGKRRNLFSDGGIKLSSTSNNSWISKIAILQHVAREVFHLEDDPKVERIFAKADAAHVMWETEGESAYWAMSDQMVSGVAQGSKYYPRCVTTWLWMASNGTKGRKAKA